MESCKYLKKELKMNVECVSFNNNYLLKVLLNLPFSQKKVNSTFFDTMDKILTYLENEGIAQPNECAACGIDKVEEETNWTIYKGLYLPLHNECIENEYEKQQALIDKENENKKFMPISIILCFVGAIVGLIPNIIVLVVSDYLIGLLFALIPICAFYGYKIGRAPIRKMATITSIIASFLTIILANLLFVVFLSQAAQVSVTTLLEDTETSRVILTTFFQTILFTCIGIAVAWGLIRKTSNGKIEKD